MAAPPLPPDGPTPVVDPLPDPRRATPEELQREIREVSASPFVTALLDVVDASLVVLNPERQILAFNARAKLERAPQAILGARLGEALQCVHARPAGCGASEACHTCGALAAIVGSRRCGGAVEAECTIRSEVDGVTATELAIRATPLSVGGLALTLVSLRDVSDARRRQALEQVFFHDVLNTVAGIAGWAEVLRHPGGDHARARDRVSALVQRLDREIRDHRVLVHAERGDLVVHRERLPAADLLDDLAALFAEHPSARDRALEVAPPTPGLELDTDRGLLLRVLANMVRNACEATPEGGAVRVTCRRAPAPAGATLTFEVWNAGAIPPLVQPRVFERSFSTKGARGRGLGTYSMKLLGERYLGGRVGFASSAEQGTTFWITLPAGR